MCATSSASINNITHPTRGYRTLLTFLAYAGSLPNALFLAGRLDEPSYGAVFAEGVGGVFVGVDVGVLVAHFV